MHKLFCIIAFFCIVEQARAQVSAYNFTIVTAKGKIKPLQSFGGKRLMVVILPGSLTSVDWLYLQRIDSIAHAMTNNFTVIAVPSYEDGYYTDSGHTLLNGYASILDSNLVVISQPTFTHASSGNQQDSFFNWLTHADLNTHFDHEVLGAGTMFFLSEQGELYAVFGPEAKWSNRVLNHVSK